MAFNWRQAAQHSKARTFQLRARFFQRNLRRLIGIVCGASLGFGSHQAAVAQGYCRADLQERVDAIANRPELIQAHLGILVEIQGKTATERHVVLEQNTDQWFVPASTLKLLTSAAALQSLGPDFTIQTSANIATIDNKAHLYIIGRGDPTFATTDLDNLVQQISQQGIQTIDHLWGYDGYFPGRTVHPNWEWEDVLAGYGASANGLILNENALGVTLHPAAIGQPLQVEWSDPTLASHWQIDNTSRTVPVGSPITADVGRDWNQPILQIFGDLPVDFGPDRFALAVTQPGRHFIEQFEIRLTQAGISVGEVGIAHKLPELNHPPVATVTSPPLSEWITKINQASNNLYTEALLKTLGHSTGDKRDVTAAGTEAVKAILGRLGVDANGYQMVDGSGLSRHNLVTPHTLVDTLQAMAYNTHSELYRNSLATADGGLSYRYGDTPVRLQAKTGYVSNNESLAGYLQPENHPPLVFSIFLNNANLSATEMRAMIDAMVVEIAQLEDC